MVMSGSVAGAEIRTRRAPAARCFSASGRLVKSPSFWVTDVDVVWTYARVGGQVLPVEMTSSGRVRMVGRSMFKMVYEYVSIQGQPVGTRLAAGLIPEQ